MYSKTNSEMIAHYLCVLHILIYPVVHREECTETPFILSLTYKKVPWVPTWNEAHENTGERDASCEDNVAVQYI